MATFINIKFDDDNTVMKIVINENNEVSIVSQNGRDHSHEFIEFYTMLPQNAMEIRCRRDGVPISRLLYGEIETILQIAADSDPLFEHAYIA